MKILIADDNPNDALLLQTWLTREGHKCTTVADGEAALAHLRRETPDLLISDILMPRLDGFALCRAVKRDPAWRTIYFVFCTATYTAEQDAALAMQLGAQRFFTKPVDFERLQSALLEIEAGQAQPSIPAAAEDLAEPTYLQMYNERLVNKLEENYRQLQITVADLRRQNEQLWTLTEASRALSAAVAETDVQRIMVQHALELVQAETVLLITLEEPDLVVSQAGGRYGGLLQGLVLPAAGTLCAQIAQNSDAVALDDAKRETLAGELLLGEPPAAAILAPLWVHENSLGLLAALHSRPDSFDTATLQTFQLLAHQASVALKNARLIDALRAQSEALHHSQDQLVHNARMATVGRLTAALAHEINNPLQSILGSVQFVLEELPSDLAQRPYLELAARELDRVEDILQRMVCFYRRDTGRRSATDINALLRDTLVLAEKQLRRHRVAVITDLASDLPAVSLAPNQFKQVFLNIILNAADAMPQGGQLQITTHYKQPPMIQIRFTDSGPGIAPPELERIFESFYTTKPHGTGLGLSISRDIINAHGGSLRVHSELGQGATFHILLPSSENSEG